MNGESLIKEGGICSNIFEVSNNVYNNGDDDDDIYQDILKNLNQKQKNNKMK